MCRIGIFTLYDEATTYSTRVRLRDHGGYVGIRGFVQLVPTSFIYAVVYSFPRLKTNLVQVLEVRYLDPSSMSPQLVLQDSLHASLSITKVPTWDLEELPSPDTILWPSNLAQLYIGIEKYLSRCARNQPGIQQHVVNLDTLYSLRGLLNSWKITLENC